MADNQTQERDQDVVTYAAFTGVRNDVDPERFAASDLFSAVNIDIDKSGRISRRTGFTRRASGAIHSLWAASDICLYVSGDQLFQLNPDYSTAPMQTLQGIGMRTSFARANDRVYYANGVDTGVIENGAARTWGIQPPDAPGIQATVGHMPAGTYQITMTYFRDDGQESGASRAAVADLSAGSGLLLTLPISADLGVVSKAVYISPPNGDTLYLAFVVGNGVTSASYIGDTTELSVPLATQFISPAPAGHLIGFYRGRMYVAVGDILYPSQPFAYEQFDLRGYIQMDGRITMVAPMTDKEREGDGQHSGLFIGTDRSCGVLVGSSPESFQYVPKTDYGAILGAVDYVDGALYSDNATGARPLPMWLTTQGICVGMPDMEIKNITRTKFGFVAAGQGAALFQPGPNRFIATSNF
jgi:hypothetical protein